MRPAALLNTPKTPSLRGAFLPVSPLRLFAACILCASTLACSAPPEVSTRAAQLGSNAPWPSLLTSTQLAQSFDPQSQNTGATAEAQLASIAQRAAQLRARAARMSGPVLDATTRKRLQAALARRANSNT
jgi:hypothetical protein